MLPNGLLTHLGIAKYKHATDVFLQHGETAIHLAAKYNHPTVISVFVSFKVNVDTRGKVYTDLSCQLQVYICGSLNPLLWYMVSCGAFRFGCKCMWLTQPLALVHGMCIVSYPIPFSVHSSQISVISCGAFWFCTNKELGQCMLSIMCGVGKNTKV